MQFYLSWASDKWVSVKTLIVIEEFADYIDDENKFTNNKPEINKVINRCFVCYK
jgi:hypothetical protein